MVRGKASPSPTLASLLLLLLAGCCCVRDARSFTAPASSSGIIIGRTTAAFVPPGSSCSSSSSSSSSGRACGNGIVAAARGLGRLSSGSVVVVVPFIRHRALLSATTPSSSAEAVTSAIEYPPASDGEALQSLFAKHCDSEGLMTEDGLRGVPAIEEMLEQGDILSSELEEIWKAAPKFPQGDAEDATAAVAVEKIDVDSFVQVYRDIDDLFENDDKEEEEEEETAAVSDDDDAAVGDDLPVEADDEGDDDDAELKRSFASLADDGTVSFSQLRTWEEISSMIDDEGVLGEDELVALWEGAMGSSGTGGSMDMEGFLKVNDALDDLFEFDDDEEDENGAGEEGSGDEEEEAPAATAAPLPIVTEEDLPPGVLFSQIAGENYLVGRVELRRWGELNDMLEEGDLTPDELDALFANAEKAPGTDDMLDEDGFCSLYDAVDALFEDEQEEESEAEATAQPVAAVRELKDELLEYIEDITQLADEEGLQLCGLDSSELEQERVVEIVTELEREPYNRVVELDASGGGAVDREELVGSWDLVYSSSSTMKYNEGLSGLAGGLTTFGGLRQTLSATKYLADVEYAEQVVPKLGGKSYEVKITGDWDMRTEVSLFTGRPSNILTVLPDRVAYGPRSDKADHWKSLGPLNLLVLSYLDEDIRIMRGNTSTDTLFIWRRV